MGDPLLVEGRHLAAVGQVRCRMVLIDLLLLASVLVVATYLRYDFHLPAGCWRRGGELLEVGGLLLPACGGAQGLYTGRWLRGSLEEARALAVTVGVVTAGLVALDLVLGHPLPAGAVLASGPMLLGAMAAARVQLLADPVPDPRARSSHRVLVFGAGSGAFDLVRAMLREPECGYRPTALLDDDPAKARLRLHGIPVRGTRADTARVARVTGADTLLIAVPSADAGLISDLTRRGRAAGLTVKVLPPVSALFERPGVRDIRPVSMVDLIGRREVVVDLAPIAGYVTDRRVLVTGAGGSIGSELCRQLRRFSPAALVMLDRDESALHELQLSMDGRAMLDERSLVVGDIRDLGRMERVLAEHRPDAVFHAAALKHLPLLQMYPEEAVMTNVIGTLNLLSAAEQLGVRRFVNISTDKAADPISVLGYSKRIAERLTAWHSAGTDPHADMRFLSVRFGNVLGSRGSVLTAFCRQLAEGRPLTVTDRDVTRFFMTIEEAVRLVIQAGGVGAGGQVLVLDMGAPVRIAEVAQRLLEESGSVAGMVFTGLRPGEKLHECLFGAGERDERPVHPQLSHVGVPPLPPAEVEHLIELAGPVGAAARHLLIDGLRLLAAAPAPDAAAPRLPEPLASAAPVTPCGGLPGLTAEDWR